MISRTQIGLRFAGRLAAFLGVSQAMFRALWSLPKEEHHGREAVPAGESRVSEASGSLQDDLQEAPTDAALRVNVGAGVEQSGAMTKDSQVININIMSI